MTSTYDDSVLDFDLNFLNQNSNGATVANTADQIKYDKQKRNISIMKKKIIATDSLIAKYYSKKQMLYEAEKNLAATKEECKQICLDYRNALEKCSNLETERHTVQNAYKTVEERCGQLENQCEAFQSHIHQLQQLVKEKDSALESLRVEKKKTINVKDYEKKVYLLERDKTVLNKDANIFADLIKKIIGKRKLKSRYSDLLRKYELRSYGSCSDISDVFEEPLSPPPPDINITKKSTIVATDSECDNSIDTGLGSSVSSDNEKFMPSPEYFINDCPTTLVTIENRAKVKVTNVATSPIIFEKTIEEPSLPMIFDIEEEDESKHKSTNTSQLRMVNRSLSPIRINTSRSVGTSPMENATIVQIEIQNEFESKDASTITDIQTSSLFESKDASTITDIQTPTLFESKDASTVTDIQTSTLFESKNASILTDIQTPSLNTIDRPISPINMTTSVSVFTSPIKCVTREIATSPVTSNEKVIHNESTQVIHERECLELNNSNNLRCDKHTDFEIEMILNTMQMNHDIITPIPRTPSRVQNSEARKMPSRLSRIVENDKETSELEELKMELNNMKNILKQHILLTSKQLLFNHEPLISKLVTDNDHLSTIQCMDTNENSLSESLLDASEIRPESNLEISQSGLVPSPIDNDLLFGSSQSSTERGAGNAQDDNTSRTSFPTLRDESSLQNFEEEETTTEVNTETLEEISEDVNDFRNQEDCEEVDEEPVKTIKHKREKRKRLSKLDKLKKKLKPKYKIRSQTPPIVKLELKAKQRKLFKKKTSKNFTPAILNDTSVSSVSVNDTSMSVNDTAVSINDSSANLNDKHVYEKAVKIMAELNSKKSSKARKISGESVNKSVTLAASEEHANLNKTAQRSEVRQGSKVTSISKKDALFEEQETSLHENITKQVTSKSQISSKEVVAQEKPTKEKLIPKKSWLPLSALFDDGDESSDSIIDPNEGSKSLMSSKSMKKSVSISKTSPSNILNDNNRSGKQTKRENPIPFRPIEEALSTRETSPLSILNDNSENTNQINLFESPIPFKPTEEALSTRETSPLSIINDNSENSNQINLFESPIPFRPIEEALSTRETSPLSILNYNSENSNQINLFESPIPFKPTEEALTTDETSPLSILNYNSENSNQINLFESPIPFKPTEEALSTSETSLLGILNYNSENSNQINLFESPIPFKPTEEALATRETSPLGVLKGSSETSNQTNCCESPISFKPTTESLSTDETSALRVLNDNSQNGNQTKLCESLASKPTEESLSTGETSPLTILHDKSETSYQINRCESPISSKPTTESLSTDETSALSVLNDNSQNGNQTKLCESLASKPTEESLSTCETSPLNILNDNSTSGNQMERCESPIPFKPTEEALSTGKKSPLGTLNDNSTNGNQTNRCESSMSSKPRNESLFTSETLPLSVLKDDGNNSNQTKLCESPASKPTKESVSTSETSASNILNDNSKGGHQTEGCTNPKASEATVQMLSTSETSLFSVLKDNGNNINQTNLCESLASKPTEESVSTSETSPSNILNDNSKSGNQTNRCRSPIASKPTKESLSTSGISPLSVLFDNSTSGNQTKRYESPISSKPAIESVSTSETSSTLLNDNSTSGHQTKHCETPTSKPMKESISTSETSLLSVLNDSSKNSNQMERESPISFEPMKQSVSTSEKSTLSTEISKTGNRAKRCKSPVSSKPSKEFLSPTKSSPSMVLKYNSTSGEQTKHSKGPIIFKPIKETAIKTPSTSETQSDKSKSENLTKSPISSKSTKETVSSETSASSTNISKIGNPKKRKSLILSEPTKKSLCTSEKSLSSDNSKMSNQAPSQTTELNLKQLSKTQKSLKPSKKSLFSNETPTGENVSNSENSELTSPKSQIATRSKFADPCFVVLTKDPHILSALETKKSECQKDKIKSDIPNQPASRKRRNNSSNEPEINCKRILRSSTVYQRSSTENKEQSNATCNDNNKLMENPSANELKINKTNYGNLTKQRKSNNHDSVISYDDLDLFSDDVPPEKVSRQEEQPPKNINGFDPKQSILCCMIDKYGVENVRKFGNKKIPDATVKTVCEKIEQYISNIIESSPAESKNLMTKFVADLQKLNHKHFIAGLMKYLTKQERKMELFSKVVSAPAPPMTKAEQILIYVILNLKSHWPSVDIVDAILTNIEYTVFKLNRTPEFNIIESISHFYALLCRYFGAKSRLRLFILDAMYCIQFKSVPLIKQCLDVWMHIIPLAHMGIAKCPLVTCLVYLLHFYKCNDRFNRVQEIRNILSHKYFYQFTDWNEAKILEMFKNSIKNLKDIPIERKMLRIALIILAKRHGPKWCQNHIIKNLLLPIIGKQNVPDNVKEFCVSMIGPLMKPYPADMKVNCEIVMNQLTEMLNKDPSQQMEEAIITSMMFINRHDQLGINKTLLSRKMKPLSPEFEGILREYVRGVPLKVWKKNISYVVHINKFN